MSESEARNPDDGWVEMPGEEPRTILSSRTTKEGLVIYRRSGGGQSMIITPAGEKK